MGDPACGGGFSPEVRGLRPSGHDIQEAGGKKHPRTAKKGLKIKGNYAIVLFCDIW